MLLPKKFNINQYFVITFDDLLNSFEHGISKGGKASGIQGYPKFFQLQLHYIGIACSRPLNLVLYSILEIFNWLEVW